MISIVNKELPSLDRIIIYPIKSLSGVRVNQARILPGGALEHDREFALVDGQGEFVNGKRTPKVHLLGSSFNFNTGILSLRVEGTGRQERFQIDDNRRELEDWLSVFFGFSIKIVRNRSAGFPDDAGSPGPTVISTGTLEKVSGWFPGITVDEMRARLRINLELGNVPAFWEDRLFDEPGKIVWFAIGKIRFKGVNPCQRCVTPTRNPRTGEVYPGFQRIFMSKRKASLPPWVNQSRFNHFYRLSVNTRVPQSEVNKTLQIGDKVKLHDTRGGKA